MHWIIALLLVVVGLALPASSAQMKAVEIVAPLPVPVDVTGPVDVGLLPPVEIAPGQQVDVPERTFLPGEMLLVQAFANSNTGPVSTAMPKTMVLRQITIAPAAIDTSPTLLNCQAIIRWDLPPPIDPASTDRIIVDHNWGGANQIALNYPFPYPLRLPAGTVLRTWVSEIPNGSGFCEAVIVFTGTVVSSTPRR